MGGGYLEVGTSRFRGRQFVLLGEGGLVSPELPRQQGGEMLSRCLFWQSSWGCGTVQSSTTEYIPH